MPAARNNLQLERDFAIAEAAVREAGTLAHGYFFARANSWKKADSSPVSEADHAVNRLLHHRLMGLREGYGWISEETPDNAQRLTRERVWIIDPIDGTRAFLNQKTTWVVSAALAIDGEIAFGFLFNPVRGEFFAAMKGAGASMNGQPITASNCSTLEGCSLLTNPDRINDKHWLTPWPQMEVSRISSFAYQVALIASARADATIAFSSIYQWDLAAADIILREAGGKITSAKNEPLEYNTEALKLPGAIAAASELHSKIADFMAKNNRC